ncbi:hypothetical protein C8Q69DRAFT_293579 [Paecilomyces variotii]|uniref:Uncharacterized protein n=1 Tax=Byssochlamys spectabilis TaxID=264951 RepID=A0A443HRK8_BYSSP|nr:hypothetical protein C8Q69DRAFT_293579 [Paecilomyces variotii]RWQ94468.1 hypothetical protein C8Q69DRAFT_293579 [Paecilomyces variotii]
MLTWHSTAPSFVSDMHVEIWQQYKKLPEREFAHIRLFPATEPEHDNRTASATSASSSNTVAGGDNGARLFILFRSMNALHHFSYMRSESQVYARSEGTTLVNCRACQSEIVFSILAVFQVMKFESRTFLEGCTDELRKMELLGRQHPSVNKMRYLVHLEDCRFGAEESVTHALSVLKTLENWIREQETEQKLWDGGQSFEQRLEILRTDLEYLQDELVHTSKAIEEMQQKIREQLSLSRGRRDFILALLAAIYLPLSFTTSFFGMNMNTNTSPGPQAFSTWTNSSLDGLPADTRNSTEAIISAMNTSGSLNWTWEQFGIMLGCLILTLPLALAAGGIFRWSVQSAARYVRYWRVLYIIAYIGFIFFSIAGSMSGGELETTGTVCNCILLFSLAFNAWNLYPARRSLSYIGLFLFTAPFVFVSIKKPFPMMIFPWVLFGCIWLIRRWQKWKQA